jgi:hypothetical protein
MKKAVIVDVIVVNSVMGLRGGKGVKGARVKGWAGGSRQGTKVDGNSPS